ncbi:MAG: hypothetical protein IJR44_01880 [Neisseriaceae bacterium]|nr:hypothetical protein [Neisseriaceae bacterium]
MFRVIFLFFLLIATCFLISSFAYLDLTTVKNLLIAKGIGTSTTTIGEISLTEITAEIFIFCSTLLMFNYAKKHHDYRDLFILMAGLYACMFLRELDALFDFIFHGFWLYPVLLVIFATGYLALRRPGQLISQMGQFSRLSSFGFVLIGLVIILAFSRLMGSSNFWKLFLSGQEIVIVKTIVQECMEFFGYSLILIGTFLLRFDLRRYF